VKNEKTKNTEQKHNIKPRPRFEGRSQHRLQFFIARTKKAGKNKGKREQRAQKQRKAGGKAEAEEGHRVATIHTVSRE